MLKAFFINSTQADYTDEEFSWPQKLLLEQGVFGDSGGTLGLEVTENSPAAMSVLISPGNALVELTKGGATWKVLVMSNAQEELAIADNSSGMNRVDAVIVRVDKDTEPNSLKNNIATVEVVEGNGTSPLSDNDIDTAVGGDGWIRLADITVEDSETQIQDSDISDQRAQVKSNDAVRPAPKKIAFTVLATDPPSEELVEGLLWYNSDDHLLKYYDGSNTLEISPANYTAGDGLILNSNEFSVDPAYAGLVPIGGIVAWLKTFGQRFTGTNTSTSANKLIDSGANFTGTQVGDIVENNTDGTFSAVTAIDSATQLSLDSDIFTGTGKTYYVWKTPKLGSRWIECNGQTIDDEDSPYDGVTAPNLNNTTGPNTQRFLRGAKRSGNTGGEDTHVLTTNEIPAHTHTIPSKQTDSFGTTSVRTGDAPNATIASNSAGGGQAHENRPPYYEVVWIMRIR